VPKPSGVYLVIAVAALQEALKVAGPPTAPSADASAMICPNQYQLFGNAVTFGYR